jgi:chemotaxis signal transduction protein
MALPDAGGMAQGQKVLNLRGTVVPVVNLGDYFQEPSPEVDQKLIIGRKADRIVALQVSRIVTIYKQVKFQETPSLNPRYQHCADILDRLIEFTGDTGIKEHVLVINVEKLLQNHLGMPAAEMVSADDTHPEKQ